MKIYDTLLAPQSLSVPQQFHIRSDTLRPFRQTLLGASLFFFLVDEDEGDHFFEELQGVYGDDNE